MPSSQLCPDRWRSLAFNQLSTCRIDDSRSSCCPLEALGFTLHAKNKCLQVFDKYQKQKESKHGAQRQIAFYDTVARGVATQL